MTGVARKPNEKVVYKYKLNENYKSKEKSMSLNGISLSCLNWTDFKESQVKILGNNIKGYTNPKGIVDEFIFDPLKLNNIPNTKLKFVHRKKEYTRDGLATMPRIELESVAKEYGIDPIKKRSSYVVNLIIAEQIKYRESLKTSEGFFEEEGANES